MRGWGRAAIKRGPHGSAELWGPNLPQNDQAEVAGVTNVVQRVSDRRDCRWGLRLVNSGVSLTAPSTHFVTIPDSSQSRRRPSKHPVLATMKSCNALGRVRCHANERPRDLECRLLEG